MDHRIHEVLAAKGRPVEIVDQDALVAIAVEQMNQAHIGSLLVSDGDRLVGIVTERDLLVRVLGAGRDPTVTKVHEVMTRELVVIGADDLVVEAMMVVSARRCRHLPVVENGKVLGLVSAGDLTAWILREQQQTIDDLHDYITR